MGPNARVDYNLILCPLQSRLQYNTFTMGRQPCARVDLNPLPESALSPSHELWIWPQSSGQIFEDDVNGFSSTSEILLHDH
jgi:hypothetical protein